MTSQAYEGAGRIRRVNFRLKPAETTPSPKVGYVKPVEVEGEELVVGCGIYGMSPEEVQKLVK